jgi:flavodoxin
VEVLIVVGTVTNNAEYVAAEIANDLRANGVDAAMEDAYTVDTKSLRAADRVIVCTSTWSEGDPPYEPLQLLPANLHDLYTELERDRPDLSGLLYAVCALGDHAYDPYFCEAGKIMEATLDSLGAAPTAARFEIDGPPTDSEVAAARAWAREAVGLVPA